MNTPVIHTMIHSGFELSSFMRTFLNMFLTPTTFICRSKKNTVKHDNHKCNRSEKCQKMMMSTNGWVIVELENRIVNRAWKNEIHK